MRTQTGIAPGRVAQRVGAFRYHNEGDCWGMSLKAKLEAVIYAAEEPVTLNQLAALFAADALEWKAAREAAAAEQTAEVAGVSPDAAQPLSLMGVGLDGEAPAPDIDAAGLPTAAAAESAPAEATGPGTGEVVSIGEAEAYPSILVHDPIQNPVQDPVPSPVAQGEPEPNPEPAPAGEDSESQARRLARQKDREVKAVLKQLLDELIAGYESEGRGVEIREIAGGYRMATKPECHDAVRLFVKSLKPPMKLSLPALETLAVIAYKQPVTAPEVNEIRGVESAGVLGSLLARKLIATAGRKPVIGRPILYKTTKEFLLRFGLKDVSELPSMEEFEKMAASELEMEPEVVEADAAEAAADAAAAAQASDGEPPQEDNAEAELESNSPSGQELAATAEVAEGEEAIPQSVQVASPELPETAPTEHDPVNPDFPQLTSPDRAEIEANLHAEEEHKEGR